ncbi:MULTISPECIES: hypothetical protein [Paenibacillus]|uniref:Uncharacterized protein n=1 Tax=Paenibacillus radicis (ex Xue et al. 2023) TaxID=2972489 RepID=A0ABT1YSM2_9BACL|nr:hypothetical protein [Paenibacillus radicis (ex Xue et al. 2023)]MCR8636183.1 hypothetical protein [Paenibacillus radicis (ex Xue et al. 2023)]
MNNFKQKEYTSRSGKQYTFQFPGVRAAAQISDRVKNKFGVPLEEKLAEEMMKNVIVDPKISWDYFGSDKKEFNDVIAASFRFLEGEDEESANADNQE